MSALMQQGRTSGVRIRKHDVTPRLQNIEVVHKTLTQLRDVMASLIFHSTKMRFGLRKWGQKEMD